MSRMSNPATNPLPNSQQQPQLRTITSNEAFRLVYIRVGAYITAAHCFTASTSFANPAVTLARAATETFSRMRSEDVPGFVLAQLIGASAAAGLVRWLVPAMPVTAQDILVPHTVKNVRRLATSHLAPSTYLRRLPQEN